MLNWQNLVPHRPLDENDSLYVPRPESDSRLAKLISVNSAPIAMAGPVGSGKSTELAQAAGHLRSLPAMDPWLVRLDRQTDMRKLTRTRVLVLIARALGLEDSMEGLDSLVREDELARVRDAFISAIRAYQSKLGKTLVVLIDGLEKCSDEQADPILRMLFELQDELRVVAIIPYSLGIGPVAGNIVQVYGAKIYSVRAIPLPRGLPTFQQTLQHPGYRFFYDLAQKRLGSLDSTPENFVQQMLRMAFNSGGVPRVYLQILLSSANNAQIADRQWPIQEDWDDALAAQRDSLRLLLRDGDLVELQRISVGRCSDAATDQRSLEIPLERRVRFLGQGLILEYEIAKKKIVRPTPLLADVFDI